MPDTCVVHHKPVEASHGRLCEKHFRQLSEAVTELPAVVAWLEANLGTRSPVTDRVSGTRTPPTPLNVEVHDHLWLLVDTATSWCSQIAEQRLVGVPETAAQASFLRRHLDWAVAQEWVVDFYQELTDLSWLAEKIMPRKPQPHRLPVCCPACDARTLVRWDGELSVTCHPRWGGCGAMWDENTYRRLVAILVEETRRAEGAA